MGMKEGDCGSPLYSRKSGGGASKDGSRLGGSLDGDRSKLKRSHAGNGGGLGSRDGRPGSAGDRHGHCASKEGAADGERHGTGLAKASTWAGKELVSYDNGIVSMDLELTESINLREKSSEETGQHSKLLVEMQQEDEMKADILMYSRSLSKVSLRPSESEGVHIRSSSTTALVRQFQANHGMDVIGGDSSKLKLGTVDNLVVITGMCIDSSLNGACGPHFSGAGSPRALGGSGPRISAFDRDIGACNPSFDDMCCDMNVSGLPILTGANSPNSKDALKVFAFLLQRTWEVTEVDMKEEEMSKYMGSLILNLWPTGMMLKMSIGVTAMLVSTMET